MMNPTEFRKKLVGPIVAMTTHFTKDDQVDLGAMRELTEFYVQSGIPTVIADGSTGEFASLSEEERRQVIETVVQTARGRMTVIAGTACPGTKLTIDLTKYAADAGADGVMITPPYYGFGGWEGLKKHYRMVAEATNIGIIVYFSGAVMHTVTNVLNKPELMLELAEAGQGHISGFKDASGNFHFYRSVCKLLKDKVAVMGSNGMNYYLYGHMFGGPCFLTGLGNIWPRVELEFDAALRRGDLKTALQIVNEKDLPYLKAAVATGTYNGAVKAMMEMAGLPGGHMRPPFLDCTAEQKEMLRRVCTEIGLLSPMKPRAAAKRSAAAKPLAVA
ncbi:MAG: dihydrodipicolinate synthase family protein [Verrucomicrobia bacterium]|nr:dihydrodipicolinate synthase family protein [Verrucomicrobiota bacterium]